MVNLLIKRSNQIINLICNYFKDTCFYAIFLIKPLQKKTWGFKNYTTSHFNKGEDYHHRFDNLPGRKIIWNIEKKILDNFLRIMQNIDHLDFAGGTGRISSYIHNKCRKRYLIDVSEKMINQAKKNLKEVVFINKDFRQIENFNEKFDLITAFRFFPNAEPYLRDQAMNFITKHLNKGGYVIFNNHKNFWSIPFIFKRLTFRSNGFGMTHYEIESILKKYNLKIVDSHSCGLFFETEKGRFTPWRLLEKLEIVFHKFLHQRRLGFNTLYLVKKND